MRSTWAAVPARPPRAGELRLRGGHAGEGADLGVRECPAGFEVWLVATECACKPASLLFSSRRARAYRVACAPRSSPWRRATLYAQGPRPPVATGDGSSLDSRWDGGHGRHVERIVRGGVVDRRAEAGETARRRGLHVRHRRGRHWSWVSGRSTGARSAADARALAAARRPCPAGLQCAG